MDIQQKEINIVAYIDTVIIIKKQQYPNEKIVKGVIAYRNWNMYFISLFFYFFSHSLTN